MSKVVSYEEACSLNLAYKYNVADMPIFKEASEMGGCYLIATSDLKIVNIFIEDEDLYDHDKEGTFGWRIGVGDDHIYVSTVVLDGTESTKSLQVCMLPTSAGLKECINKAKETLSTCPNCGKAVNLRDIRRKSISERWCVHCMDK